MWVGTDKMLQRLPRSEFGAALETMKRKRSVRQSATLAGVDGDDEHVGSIYKDSLRIILNDHIQKTLAFSYPVWYSRGRLAGVGGLEASVPDEEEEGGRPDDWDRA